MKQNFAPNSIETNTSVLSSYLPEGKLYDAKNTQSSNFYQLIASFAQEYTRVQEKINELATESDMSQTQELIEAWEEALGIPDSCFTTDVSLTQRQLQCVVKFAQMNVQTEADFVQLANTLGYQIEIIHSTTHAIFPMIFPILLGTAKQARFTMIVKFIDINKPTNVFPITFSFTFQTENLIECIFSYLKPANVKIIYWYKDYP